MCTVHGTHFNILHPATAAKSQRFHIVIHQCCWSCKHTARHRGLFSTCDRWGRGAPKFGTLRSLLVRIDQSMKNVALPSSLQSLTFGYNFDQSMENVVLPRPVDLGKDLAQLADCRAVELLNEFVEGPIGVHDIVVEGVKISQNVIDIYFKISKS